MGGESTSNKQGLVGGVDSSSGTIPEEAAGTREEGVEKRTPAIRRRRVSSGYVARVLNMPASAPASSFFLTGSSPVSWSARIPLKMSYDRSCAAEYGRTLRA